MTKRSPGIPAHLPGRLVRLGMAALDRFDGMAGIAPRDRESGAATVEFAIMLPVFLLIFISTFESSIMLYRQVMLERAVDIATRQVRLDSRSAMTSGELQREICREARILSNCDTHLVVELQIVNPTTYALPSSAQPCYERATETVPNLAAWPGNRGSQVMTLRACYSAEPFFPTSGLGAQIVSELDGESIRMVAATAFQVEPP